MNGGNELDTQRPLIADMFVTLDGLASAQDDRLRLTVFPQILGATGQEPIFSGLPDLNIELVGSEALDSRLLVVEARPAH